MKTLFAEGIERPQLLLKKKLLLINWPFLALVTAITLIGYSAMAGAVGAGGLGDIAIRYGYHRYQPDVMLFTLVLMIIIVCIIQFIFGFAANRIDKKNRS